MVSGGHNPETEEALARSLPAVATQLREALLRLEQDFADMQDVEFTIEDGKLWMLQTRSAKRTPQAALRLAIDFVKEGRIAAAERLRRLDGLDLRALVKERLVIGGSRSARNLRIIRYCRRPRRFRFRKRGAFGRRAASHHPRASRYHDRRCWRLCRSCGNCDGVAPHRPCRAVRGRWGSLHRRLHGIVDRRRRIARSSPDAASKRATGFNRRRSRRDLSRPRESSPSDRSRAAEIEHGAGAVRTIATTFAAPLPRLRGFRLSSK